MDHPRVCGEKKDLASSVFDTKGSPPRVRGKAPDPKEKTINPRITPACAGKRLQEEIVRKRYGDHPRVCGEKQTIVGEYGPELGSPPRVRGKVELHHQDQTHVGITPACAGKRGKEHSFYQSMEDHPRVCGEKAILGATTGGVNGSPPRVRGKVAPLRLLVAVGGITPACAGKSMDHARKQSQRRDHPRACGEKLFHKMILRLPKGSPPRMRGKGINTASISRRLGITPAHAGKSPQRSIRHNVFRDHPRACGEKLRHLPGRFSF